MSHLGWEVLFIISILAGKPFLLLAGKPFLLLAGRSFFPFGWEALFPFWLGSRFFPCGWEAVFFLWLGSLLAGKPFFLLAGKQFFPRKPLPCSSRRRLGHMGGLHVRALSSAWLISFVDFRWSKRT